MHDSDRQSIRKIVIRAVQFDLADQIDADGMAEDQPNAGGGNISNLGNQIIADDCGDGLPGIKTNGSSTFLSRWLRCIGRQRLGHCRPDLLSQVDPGFHRDLPTSVAKYDSFPGQFLGLIMDELAILDDDNPATASCRGCGFRTSDFSSFLVLRHVVLASGSCQVSLDKCIGSKWASQGTHDVKKPAKFLMRKGH